MSKVRLATIIVIGIFITVLAVSVSVNQVKANHCHPSHTKASTVSETTPTPSNRTIGSTVSNNRPNHNKTRVLSINNKSAGTRVFSLDEIYSRDFPEAILSIGEAVKAIQSGDRQTELAELNKALEKMITIHKALGAQAKPQYANNLHCPVMGSPVYINRVDIKLTRDYKGRIIAFCCPGCPAEWDKLTEAQKQAKLTGVKS